MNRSLARSTAVGLDGNHAADRRSVRFSARMKKHRRRRFPRWHGVDLPEGSHLLSNVLTTLTLRLIVGVVILGLTLSALACVDLGRRVGQRRVALLGKDALEGFGSVEGAVFGLLGLLLAFTFSAAASRYDTRRDLIVKEANAVGTAYLRLDLLPPAAQPELRRLFGQYLDSRLAIIQQIHQLRYPAEELARVTSLQGRIWKAAVAGCRASDTPQTMLMVMPAVNEMIDLGTTRSLAVRAHIPAPVLVLLVVVSLAGSILAGYGMAHVTSRSWAHMIAFAAILSISVYVILDYEFPRIGLIRLDWVDQILAELRSTMPA